MSTEHNITVSLDESLGFLAIYEEDRVATLSCLSREEKRKYLSGLTDSGSSLNILRARSKDHYYLAPSVSNTTHKNPIMVRRSFRAHSYGYLNGWRMNGKMSLEY